MGVHQLQVRLDYKSLVDNHAIKYIAYGLQTCPTTNRAHHQGWMSFDKPKSSVKKVAALLGSCHVETMKGSLDQNDKYCSRQTAGVLTEFSKHPREGQGNRTDLEDLKTSIQTGSTTVD